jgi:hypothetical protein
MVDPDRLPITGGFSSAIRSSEGGWRLSTLSQYRNGSKKTKNIGVNEAC